MFIPYELGQEVYVFDMGSIARLIKVKIDKINIDSQGVHVVVEGDSISNCYNIFNIYPCKSIAKQVLLEMSVGRISKALED